MFADVAGFLRDEQQFTMCVDITAADHLLDGERYAPVELVAAGVAQERFEVIANFLSHVRNRRIRVICAVPDSDDTKVPSLTGVYPGTDFPERETYDLYGIEFEGHPDLTRILMPDDWDGHPLRKDYPSGTRSRDLQRGPAPAMSDFTRTEHEDADQLREEARLERQTDEGAQELKPKPRVREVVLTGGGMWPEDESDDTMIINMGPQHPSTHGVLRLMMELDSEEVVRVKPVIGYLHTGMEKTGEELTYVQGGTNVTRMDYASPLSNELVYSMAVERLLDVDVPPRATWIRMMLVELNRMSSHLLFQATNGMDIGAISMMLYGWREREEVLRYLEIHHRLADEPQLHPSRRCRRRSARWLAGAALELCDTVTTGINEYDELLSENPIWRERTIGLGLISTEECLARSITGPILRSTGFAWDLRKAQPYLAYDEVDFDVMYGMNGDVFDRYRLRLSEIHESIKIVRQCVERMPAGDYRTQDKKLTPPPRARIDESMEALIHHFKLFTEGFKVPAGETYVAIESPRGEIGCYIVSDGSGKPVRMHIRGPSFYNLQSIEPMGTGALVADAVAIVSSVDPIMGEVDR